VVLYGGAGKNDLWVYEAEKDRWTEIRLGHCPPTSVAAVTYDVANDVVVIFNKKGETWTLKINRLKEKR